MVTHETPIEMKWLANGENSLVILFEHQSGDNLSIYCQQIAKHLREDVTDLQEVIPARESITLVSGNIEAIRADIEKIIQSLPGLGENPTGKQHLIPVCYDERVAPDLVDLSERLNITVDELAEIHQDATYQVDMLGFIPGFLYLSGLPGQLHQARKDTPAISVPSGSIAIGGNQTGIYSLESPGGWWVIGRTPAKLIAFDKTPPMSIEPLDSIRFQSISYEQWLDQQHD